MTDEQLAAIAARAEVAALRATLATWQATGDAIMLAVCGRAAPLSDSDVIGEVAELRAQVAECHAQLAAVPIDAMLECIGPDDYDFSAPAEMVAAFASWLEAQRSTRR